MNDSTSSTMSIILGAVTATGVGTVLFQAIGTLVLGLIGALGGYLFQKFVKPKLDKIINKISKKSELEA